MPIPELIVPLARPELGAEEIAAVSRVLASGWLTMGPEVEAFEREFADTVGAPAACAVSSGTAALHLALLVAGVRAGDEVITVSHSYIATANAIRHCGATPVFADIEPANCNIDPAGIEPLITPCTRAIVAVHQMGMPCAVNEVVAIARRHGLCVIEDAACAVGSSIRTGGQWRRVGLPHADIACFSLHPRKLLTTGDGGMITTARPEWIERLRRLRNQGMDTPSHQRFRAAGVLDESYPEIGYNYRMTDVQAAIGRVQLRRLEGMLQRRRQLADRYRASLAGLPWLSLPQEPDWARSNWQSFATRLAPGIGQRALRVALRARGIATQRGIMNAHREPAWPHGTWRCAARQGCACSPFRCAALAHSERAQDESLLLPLFSTMTDAEQDLVVHALLTIGNEHWARQ